MFVRQKVHTRYWVGKHVRARVLGDKLEIIIVEMWTVALGWFEGCSIKGSFSIAFLDYQRVNSPRYHVASSRKHGLLMGGPMSRRICWKWPAGTPWRRGELGSPSSQCWSMLISCNRPHACRAGFAPQGNFWENFWNVFIDIGGFHSHAGTQEMVGLFQGKSHLEMDDDWGYPYLRNPPDFAQSRNSWRFLCPGRSTGDLRRWWILVSMAGGCDLRLVSATATWHPGVEGCFLSPHGGTFLLRKEEGHTDF